MFTLPELPWAKNALEPHISEETINYHYGKHHNGYVTKLNNALPDSPYANASLEEIIQKADGGMFNNAAQVWNHTFYWNSLSPNGGGAPTGAIAEAINQKWGSFEDFQTAFSDAAKGNFGSGWTWLVKTADGGLEIVNTDDAGCPLTANQKPILTLDVWEHAYYIDYRNARPDYINAFWQLVNWDFANQNLA